MMKISKTQTLVNGARPLTIEECNAVVGGLATGGITKQPPTNDMGHAWISVDPNTTPGVTVDVNPNQDGIIYNDANHDGKLFDSPGEYLALFDHNTNTAITYTAEGTAGVVSGINVGVDGGVVGVSEGSNGHIFIDGGVGTPGGAVYAIGTNDIEGIATGPTASWSLGAETGSVSMGGSWGYGVETPDLGVSATYGIDLTNLGDQIGTALGDAWNAIEGFFGIEASD